MPSDGKSSNWLWQGELIKKSHQNWMKNKDYMYILEIQICEFRNMGHFQK
jgi:hypothetical protein